MFGYIHIRRRLIELLATHHISKMAIIRCPSKKEVDGLKMADLAAYSLPQFIATAPNPVAILKQIKLQFAGHSHHTPSQEHVRPADGGLQSGGDLQSSDETDQRRRNGSHSDFVWALLSKPPLSPIEPTT